MVTSVLFGERAASRSMRVAHSAMMTSPSTIWPFSSTMITRSASPSSAMPIGAPRFTTSCAHVLGVQRAGVAVDVLAVRLHAERDDVGAELGEDRGRDLVGGAVRRIDDDAHAVEREVVREGRSCRRRRSARARPRALRRVPMPWPGGTLRRSSVVSSIRLLDLGLLRRRAA